MRILVFVVAAALATACGHDPTCEETFDHTWPILSRDGAYGVMAREIGVQVCKEKPYPKALLACYMTTKTRSDIEECERKFMP